MSGLVDRLVETVVGKHLPEDTACLTPEERRESIRRRLISMHRRLQTDY